MPPTQDCFTLDQVEEEFEDTKGVIRISKSKDRQQTQWLKEKGQTKICKTYT